MKLNEYIQSYYEGKKDWFQQETALVSNYQRVQNVLDMRNYINGNGHRILNQKTEIYNGQEYKPKGILVDMISLAIDFHVNYLLRNTPTVTSSSEDVSIKIRKVYEDGFYEDTDIRVLEDLIKFGNSYEYVFINSEGTIKSKVINPEDAYPIYSPVTSEMIGFIEHYTIDNISYWNVYDDSSVVQYSDDGGNLKKIGEYTSLSGLPIHYRASNELDHNFGRSELIRLIPLLDDYESNLSKFSDTFFKMHSPILFTYGNRNDQYKMFPSIVGQGVSMELDSKAEMIAPRLDQASFRELMGRLFIDFITIAGIPSVAINHSEISNVSTSAISMMYENAETKAGIHAMQLKRGFRERWKKIRKLMEYNGISLDNEGFSKLSVIFRTAKPFNSTEEIDNMATLQSIGGISQKTIIENSPFSVDTELEYKRIMGEDETNSSKEPVTVN